MKKNSKIVFIIFAIIVASIIGWNFWNNIFVSYTGLVFKDCRTFEEASLEKRISAKGFVIAECVYRGDGVAPWYFPL